MTETPRLKSWTPKNKGVAAESEIVHPGVAVWDFIKAAGGGAFRLCKRFLEEQSPSVIFISAFVFFVLAALIVQLALEFMPGTEQVKQIAANGQSWYETRSYGSLKAVSFISACAYYTKVAAMMLAVWAIVRLFVDAIKQGAKT